MSLLIPDDTAAIELALRAWVLASTGLASANVYWQHQTPPPPRPTSQFITLHMPTLAEIGRDWNRQELIEGGAAGVEVRHLAEGPREGMLSIQCFAGASTGTASPRAMLERVRARAKLPTIAAALHAAGIGILRYSAIASIGGEITTTVMEPRSTLTVFFSVGSQVSETGTSIESVTVAGTVDD